MNISPALVPKMREGEGRGGEGRGEERDGRGQSLRKNLVAQKDNAENTNHNDYIVLFKIFLLLSI